MGVYNIVFAVTKGRVTPEEPQAAGYDGDHRAATVRFRSDIVADTYRIEIVDGSGAYDITDRLYAVDGIVSYDIPSSWTTAGVASVRLVCIDLDEDGLEERRMHSAPGYLVFEDRDDGELIGTVVAPSWQQTMDEAQALLDTAERKLVNGELKGEKGDPGDEYILTDADKQEIAHVVLDILPSGDEVAY